MTPPLDPSQFRIWHRMRRMRAAPFVLVGATLATVGVMLLHAVVVAVLLGAPWRIMSGYIGWLALIVFALCFGAFAWTWSYMQRRYAATLGRRCPVCGYDRSRAATDRCPECGAEVGVASPGAE